MPERKRLSQSEFAAIVRAHQTLQAGRPGGMRANLSFHDLHDLDMSRANLSDADFTDASFREANLDGANMDRARVHA
jgi:uncharacterized protein YjbI with pentapeptide repeats